MNKDKKIVIDCRMYSYSGIGRYIKDIVPSICNEYQSVVLLGKPDELQQYKREFKSVEIIEMNTPIYSIKEQFDLPKKIPVCDIFLSPHYNVPLLSTKAKKRVTTIHDVYPLAFYNKLGLLQKIYAKLFFNGALKKSDKVITISEFSRSELLKYTSPKYQNKIVVIYRFVWDIVNTVNDRDVLDNSLDQGLPYFLFVGNVKPNKNLKRALLAFKKLIAETNTNRNLVFKIVGKKDGFINGEEGIQDIIGNDSELEKRVQFTGYLTDSDLRDLYKNAICMVFPSLYEGFGLPPLEAMIFGCPTITSDAASLPEVCGDATLYFDPYNIDDITNKMRNIMDSPILRSDLVGKGFEQVKKFNKENAVQEHFKLFQSLLEN